MLARTRHQGSLARTLDMERKMKNLLITALVAFAFANPTYGKDDSDEVKVVCPKDCSGYSSSYDLADIYRECLKDDADKVLLIADCSSKEEKTEE